MMCFLCSASFALGIGNSWFHATHIILKLAIILIVIAGVQSLILGNKYSFRPSTGQISLALILGLFLYLFYDNQNPAPGYDGKSTFHEQFWWHNLLLACGLSAILGIFVTSSNKATWIAGFFAAGSFVISSCYVLISLIFEHKIGPFILNPLDNYHCHRCGISNLLLLLPCFLVFYCSTNYESLSRVRIIIGASLYAYLSGVAYFTESRFTFIVLYLVVPLLIGCYKIIKTKSLKRKALIAVVLALIISLSMLCARSLPRAVDTKLLHDGRLAFSKNFIEQLIADPFCYASKPQWLEESIGGGGIWFHNFFADVHRSSGLFAFVASALLYLFIGVRCLQLVIRNKSYSYLFLLFMIVSLMLVTSVVPEGEFQPLLLLILIGSISEALLKNQSKTGSITVRDWLSVRS